MPPNEIKANNNNESVTALNVVHKIVRFARFVRCSMVFIVCSILFSSAPIIDLVNNNNNNEENDDRRSHCVLARSHNGTMRTASDLDRDLHMQIIME